MNTDLIILEYFIENHPADAVRILERLKIEETASFLKELPIVPLVNLFQLLERYTAVKCLEMMEAGRAAAIVEKLSPEIAAPFLRRLKKEFRESILSVMTGEIAGHVRQMLHHPEDSAAAIMDPLIFTLPADITVNEAIKRVRKRPEQALYYIYVLRRDYLLAGVINLRELLLAPRENQLSSVMHTHVVSLQAEATLPAVLGHPGWANYHALPVVDRSGIFLGVVRYETLRRIEREAGAKRVPREALIAGNALGDLYRIGLSGLIRGVAEPFTRQNKERGD